MKYIIFIIVTVLVWAYSDSLPFRSEVVVYKITCTRGLKNGECDSEEQTAKPATYKAIVEQQSVVYWFGNDGAPQRLQHCVVRDAQNWLCQLGDNTGAEWQMVDGGLNDVDNHAPNCFYAVSKWYWWWVRIRE